MPPADPQTKQQDSEPAPDHASRGKSERSSGAAVTLFVLLLLLASIVYIAAIGPLVWLNSRGYIQITEDGVIATIYTPVILLADKVEPIDDALQWYVELWESPTPAPMPVVTPAPMPSPTPGANVGTGVPLPAVPVPLGPPTSTQPATPTSQPNSSN